MTTQSKITLWSVLIAVLMIVLAGWATHYTLKSALVQAAHERLTLARNVKIERVESYFSDRTQSVEQLGRDARMIPAMQDFGTALIKIGNGEEILPENMSAILRQNYDRKILPRIRIRLGQTAINDNDFWPKRNVAQYLHSQYVVPTVSSSFQTDYQIAHLRHHDVLEAMLQNINAKDLLLIDAVSGDIVYTVNKNLDLGMNILNGPYGTEAMIDLFNYVKTGSGQVGVSDLGAYLPDDNVNSLFIGAPIIHESSIIGILMIRLSSEELTDIVSAKMDWKNIGLGETGDMYLAGADYFMRSNSRFAQQDIKTFVDKLRSRGVERSMVRQIDRQDSTVLAQEVRTDDVAAALNGGMGFTPTRDYRGAKVMSAYAPLDIPNMNWVIIAKQDSAEILGSINNVMWRKAVYVPFILVLVWILSRWFAIQFVKSRALRNKRKNPGALLKSTSRVLDAMHDEETS